jgi:hypothetical protein
MAAQRNNTFFGDEFHRRRGVPTFEIGNADSKNRSLPNILGECVSFHSRSYEKERYAISFGLNGKD